MPITKDNEEEIKKLITTYSKKLETDNVKFNHVKLGKIIQTYKDTRDNIKNYMLENDDGTVVIDRHKVCAVLTAAILRIEPLEVIDNKLKLTSKERSANIYLTFFTNLQIIRDFYFQETKQELHIEIPITYTKYSYQKEYQRLIKNNSEVLIAITQKPEKIVGQIIFFLSHLFFYIELYSIKVKNNNT